jgi:hypothetical protein
MYCVWNFENLLDTIIKVDLRRHTDYAYASHNLFGAPGLDIATRVLHTDTQIGSENASIIPTAPGA